MAPPNEIRLANDDVRLTVLPDSGCRWTSLHLRRNAAWLDLLKPALNSQTAIRDPLSYGCFIMAPWPNRVAGATFQFAHETFKLRSNADDGSAIHGDVCLRPWRVTAATPNSIEAELDSSDVSDFNFPFPLRFSLAIRLQPNGVSAEFSIQNAGDRPVPAGFGFHPYFRRWLSSPQDVGRVSIPAGEVYPSVHAVPTGATAPVAKAGIPIADVDPSRTPLDHGFTRMEDGPLRIVYPESRLAVDLKLDPAFDHVYVYAPTIHGGTPADFICVEPMTMAVNGFNLAAQGREKTGVRLLGPSERMTAAFTILFRDTP